MAQVFSNVPAWNNSTVYYVNDVVTYNNVYYFCRQESCNNKPDTSPVYWNSETVFGWSPSFGTNIGIDTPIIAVPFGEGYTQTYSEGIGSILLKPFTLKFELIDDKQVNAMSIFLSNPNNNQCFQYTVPPPHNRVINAVVNTWSTQKVYDNNHT